MKRTLPVFLRSFLIGLALILTAGSSYASHIVGGDLYYTWQSGNTYKITLVLYGNCGSAALSTAFSTLADPTAAPQICIYDGTTLLPGMPFLLGAAVPLAGSEITPVCPDSAGRTQCTNTAFATPGIKKYVYSGTFTLPYASANWRFVFNSSYGPSSAGRAAAITNIVGPGGTSMELTATLNNTIYSNSSALLTVVPTPFFCINNPTCYTPGAIDPEGDSIRFDLIPAINASGSCATPGGPVTYVGPPTYAWGTTTLSATTPLRCVAGSFSFDAVSGQVCFTPNVAQRAIVVYKVSEYRGGTLVGTSMREMTYLVQTCQTPPPVPGPDFDTGIVADGLHTYHICGDAGTFSITFHPTSTDLSRTITCTATGLPFGLSFSVTGNGTATPTCRFNGDAGLIGAGVYTFFVTLRDNACPVNGITTTAYTLTIYPVPTISHTILAQADCTHKAAVRIVPGGTGQPWTIKVSNPTLTAPFDTIHSFVDSVAFIDSLEPGPLPGPNIYILTIYTSVSTECGLWDTVRLTVPPKLVPVGDTVHPSHCGKNDGSIILANLNPGGIDTVTYDKFGVPQPQVVAVVSPSGTLTIPGLRAGVYSNIVVHYGYCTSNPIGPITLVDPPFTLRAVTYQNPTKCGFCDGSIKLYGLHPDQLDTITYSKNGITQPSTSYYINSDSLITLSGMCDGIYTTFNVKTAGTCTSTLLDVLTLSAPPIGALFDTTVKYGCKGDTVYFTNHSFPASDLTYSWVFGDGGTATGISPYHVYTNTTAASYVVKLYVTNTKCVDSAIKTLNLDHHLKADFTMNPPLFLCQIDSVTFTNASTGSPTVDYKWYFADGGTATSTDVVHSYSNMGSYITKLVAHNIINPFQVDLRHCYDTMKRTIVVDSNSVLTLKVSGDVDAICRGQLVTVNAIYTNSGEVGNSWVLTDGFAMNNVNPVMHSFEALGTVGANFNAKFRACPEKTASVSLRVYDIPSMYLGPDTAICVGSSPIILKDDKNIGDPKATWEWKTGEKTPMLTVTKPGIYVATVTIDGCTTTDTVIVKKDCYVDVPNIFTPNGDGVNDYFFPRQLLTKSLATFKMDVYNRWGQLVYETTTINGQGWDGSLNGVPQPTGVYVYVIDATFKDGQMEQHTGNVTIIR